MVTKDARAQTIDLLIEHGVIITVDPNRRVLNDGAVAVDRGRILDIGPTEELAARYRGKECIDAARMAVLPGFLDTHGHAGHSLLRHVGEHTSAFGWRNLVDHIYFRGTTPEFWRADGLLSTLERVKFGTTTGISMLGSAPRSDDPVYADAFARGAAEVGSRTVIAIGPPRPPFPRVFSDWRTGRCVDHLVSYERCLEVTDEVIRQWNHGAQDRVRVWVSCSRFIAPSPYDPMFDEKQLGFAVRFANDLRSLADRHRTGIHTHSYGGAIKFVHERTAALGPDVILAHCTGTDDEEIEILAKTGAKVSHCPTSGRIYQFPARVPVVEMLERGVTVAIGSDGTAHQTFDLFKDMRMAIMHQRLHFFDPYVMPAGKVLEMVTIDAARAFGVEQELGSIEVGKRADVILVDLWQAHVVPLNMLVHRIVDRVSGSDVHTVIVDGKVVVRDHRSTQVDENDVLELAQAQAAAMIERSDVQDLMGMPRGFWGSARY